MEQLVSVSLSEFPYSNLKKIADLIYYEGPLLTHFQDERKNNFFYYWLDEDDDNNRWLVLRLTFEHLYEYLASIRNLKSIFSEEYNHTAIVIDIDSEVNYNNILFIELANLPIHYFPSEKSFYKFGLPKAYEKMFEQLSAERNYEEVMRAKSVFFKVDSLETTFGKTLAVNDVSNFLQKLTRSFRNYTDARFKKLFKDYYKTDKKLNNALNNFVEYFKPRVVGLDYKSFGVDLATDVLRRPEVPLNISIWQKNLLEEYKHDVIDFDFSSLDNLSENLKGLTNEQLFSIFQPIIQLSNNPKFTVQVSNPEKGDIKKIQRIQKDTEIALFPKPEVDSEIDQINDTEFASIVLELEKGRDFSDLRMADIKRALLSLKREDRTSLKYEEITTPTGNKIPLLRPIEFNLTKINKFYEITFEPLGISKLAVDWQEALDEFNADIYNLYSKIIEENLETSNENLGSRSEKQKKQLQVLKDYVNPNNPKINVT